jgi:hypothetical protein
MGVAGVNLIFETFHPENESLWALYDIKVGM